MKREYLKREIILVDFNNNGCVLTGVHPAIYLGSIPNSTTCLVIPLTSNNKKEGYYNHIKIYPTAYNELETKSYALVESIICINKEDIEKSLGFCSEKEYKQITEAINKFIK